MPKITMDGRTEIEAFLRQQNLGRLGTTSDNYPYVVPLCFVYYRNAVYFHSGLKGQKIECISKNPRVCFQVDQIEKFRADSSPCNYSITYRSVIVYGTVCEVTEDEEKIDVLLSLASKFYGNEDEMQSISVSQAKAVKVFKINIDYMTGKANH